MEIKEKFLKELEKRLDKIKKIFDIKKILSLKIDRDYIDRYYRINKIPYYLFHTSKRFIHMGISRDGVYREEDLLGQVKIVENYIERLKARKVLELSVAKGGNSIYLAQKFPNVNFYGIDISKTNLGYSFDEAKLLTNFFPGFGDFHNLNRFEEKSFDIVFIIESLCHSVEKDKVLREVHRILKREGIFIVIDGYLNKNQRDLKKNEKLSINLASKGLAVAEPEFYSDFINKAKKIGFNIFHEENLSPYVLPTMERFEKIVKPLFKFPYFPFLFRITNRIFPHEFTYNIISAYLMPLMIKMNIASYMITVLEKS